MRKEGKQAKPDRAGNCEQSRLSVRLTSLRKRGVLFRWQRIILNGKVCGHPFDSTCILASASINDLQSAENGETSMLASVLLADGESLAGGIAFAAAFMSIAAYLISVQWRKARQAQVEADLKREMIAKGMSADEIQKVLNMSGPPVD
jgi:hypothetical protein